PDKQHYSTARDTARIAEFLIRDFPDYYRWYSEPEFTYNNIPQQNRNLLLRREPPIVGIKVDGMKTGYTEAAGYCLVASAKQGEMRLISVVMGTKNEKVRAEESEKMLDYGFRFFETYRLYQAYKPLDIERVWQGNTEQLQLGLSEPLYVTIPKGQQTQLNATGHINRHIMAPVTAGKTYGRLQISLGSQVISERPLVALTEVEVGNLWNKLMDSFLLLFY
ncbi:MAG TPA: D-alanyl-D-alanine carboxypeptidase, partial [Thioploca sp.]|nr:D-alanyl-D-alanine carboxypeptidase [Thioploca sp.]